MYFLNYFVFNIYFYFISVDVLSDFAVHSHTHFVLHHKDKNDTRFVVQDKSIKIYN